MRHLGAPRRRPPLIVASIVFIFATSAPKTPQAGTCVGGGRAFLRYSFELCLARFNQLFDNFANGLSEAWRSSIDTIGLLARWNLQSQFVSEVGRVLNSTEKSSSSALHQTLEPLWVKLWQVRTMDGDETTRSSELSNLVNLVLVGRRVCQGVQTGSLTPCLQLDGGDLREDCFKQVLDYGFLHRGRCQKEIMDRAAQQASIPEELLPDMSAYCIAVSRQQPQLCDELKNLGENDRRRCRAISGAGKAACSDAPTEKELQNCLRAIHEYEFSHSDARTMPFSFNDPATDLIAQAALLKLRYPAEDCNGLVIGLLGFHTKQAFDIPDLPWWR